MLQRMFFVLFALTALARNACAGAAATAEQSAKPAPVIADPKATAEWLATVFTVKDGQVFVAGRPAEHYLEARLPFKRPTEIRIFGHAIIADQEGMYPLQIGPTDEGYRVKMYTPFYDFLDAITGTDGLPDRAPHPKAQAMKQEGFRAIAESLHAFFTKATGQLPERHRVLDPITFPSEHYIWSVGRQWIILTAYDGNDSDGIYLSITDAPSFVEELRKMPHTDMEVFRGWGSPMPSRPEGPKK
jgi:hypothetical protein